MDYTFADYSTTIRPNKIMRKFATVYCSPMKLIPVFLLGLMAAFFAGCASRAIPSSNRVGDYNAYNEDLATARPVYSNTGSREPATARTNPPATPPATPVESRKITNVGSAEALHINRKVDEQLTLIGEKNRAVRYAPGYRVQVYIGNERQQAEAAKLAIYQNFPELTAYLSYNQPTYKLKVGDFMRRIDVERYQVQIKQLVPSAMIQPDKVDIRRSLLIK